MIEILYNLAKEDDNVFLVIVIAAYDMFRVKSNAIAIPLPPPEELFKKIKEIFGEMAEDSEESVKEEEKH